VGRPLAASLERLQSYKERFPALAEFMRPDGSPLQAGDTLRQGVLAGTLDIIADGGPDGFYRGPVAEAMVSEMRSGGGIMSSEDLARYDAVQREPVRGSDRGYEIISAPPPSSGGTTLIEILNILEGFDLQSMGFMSAESIHYMAEADRRAYVDRARYLGDPDFVDNPVMRMISKDYAATLRGSISRMATPSSNFSADTPSDREKAETTHYSVIDRDGNAVAVTYTLNDSFGSKLLVRGAGFLLNNEMDDFAIKPGHPNLYGLIGNESNAIAPEKRMLSSMAPTIVLDKGRVFLIAGTPGGSTIITTIAQIIIDTIDFGMSLEEAVRAPRFHHQWLPDHIAVEKGALDSSIRESLIEKGHRIENRSDPIGDAQVIEVIGQAACGMSDPRGSGSAGGAEPAKPRRN
ncbi:MAG: gamma-glutamyltransferase, partial [Candidatus Krumholzibacteria bacterium]|nr:gamma-glutamyltransferase [Candidatus Krumholzibacteria bacterium]